MLGRTIGRIGLLLVLLLMPISSARTEESPPAPPKKIDAEEIRRLIDQLGDEKFTKREEAMRQLRALGEQALDAVEKALRSEDAEVRNRAEKLAVDLRHIRRERLYRAMAEKFKDLPLDQFVDHMATRKEFDKPENWDRLYDIAKVLSKRAENLADRKWPVPNLNYKTFPTVSGRLAARCMSQKICADGIDDRVGMLQNCILVSGGNVQSASSIFNSIIFINGDLKACSTITNSFIFCNGSLGRVAIIRNSVILTTGDFAGSTRADHSFFQVKSVGRHTVAAQNVYLNLDSVSSANSTNNRFIQNEKGPLESVFYFKPSLLGIEISKSDGRVRIEKVMEGKPFARAGLRAGDIIAAAEGSDVASVEALNKILRRRLPGESIILKIRREGKVVEVKVTLPQ